MSQLQIIIIILLYPCSTHSTAMQYNLSAMSFNGQSLILYLSAVDTVQEALSFYAELLQLKKRGLSINKALQATGKRLNTLKRIEALCQLQRLKPALFEEVCLHTL